MIPTPKKCDKTGRLLKVDALIYVDSDFREQAEVFMKYAGITGCDFEIIDGCKGINVGVSVIDKDIEGYIIDAKDTSVKIYAGNVQALNNAFSSLLQLMTPDGKNAFTIEEQYIEDKADNWYRGLMVDLARVWHDYEMLYQYVDMCYYYKISVLHLHFTDDQSYTLPSRILPKVPTEGRHYTFGQIAALNKYAKMRGIEIMPEIDVPGHCTSFQKGYPELFGTSGVLCQHKDAVETMQELFRELCDMFPYSKHIHIGGDEAAIDKWCDCDGCKAYAKSVMIEYDENDRRTFSEKLYVNFVVKMAEAVIEKGRKPIVWEGFSKEMNDIVPRDIIVMSWENYYQITPDLLEAGFDIINCSWNPMYVVVPVVKWPVNELYDWSVFRWKPVHPGSPFAGKYYESEPSGQILGGQLLAWGDQIENKYEVIREGVLQEQQDLLERAPYLSENTWNTDKVRSFEEISKDAEESYDRIRRILEAQI